MNNLERINQRAKKNILTAISKFILNSSEERIKKIIKLLEIISPQKDKPFFENMSKNFSEKSSYYNLYKKILINSNKNFRDKLINNLLINGAVLNQSKRNEAKKNGSSVPTVILISPTMRCNLKCFGCYANNYSKKDDLDVELVSRVINEGKELGVAFFTFLGGEPFIWDGLLDILKKHSDVFFLVFTNGTLINSEIVNQIAELGNVLPILSIEGTEQDTNNRRGNDVYKIVLNVMEMLKNKNLPFGYSITVTRNNLETVTDDDFFYMMAEMGAIIGWYFLYMPVGKDFDISLMPTPQQRLYLKDKVVDIRKKLPLFVIDFWGDAPFVGGCIAASRYIHINHKGDVEPCIFSHFAEVNIKNISLKDALNCNYFKEIRKRQPYNENLYLPCMIIDNPSVSRELFKNCNIYSTDGNSERVLFEIDKELDNYAQNVKKLYDVEWEKEKDKFIDKIHK